MTSQVKHGQIPIYDRTGKEVGTYEIDPAEFAPRINKQLLHDAVVMYQANRRQGSHQTKSRAAGEGLDEEDVSAEGHRQRPGRLAAVAFGAAAGTFSRVADRDYSIALPRKAVQLATRMAIASKIRDDEVVLVDELAVRSAEDARRWRPS